MIIGACRFDLILPENHSLKGKRSVVKSICAQVRRKFNVSIAEVEAQDSWQVAVLGFSVVSSDGRHVDRMMSSVVDFIDERMNAEAMAQLGGFETEHFHAL
jgi:uncharacterized protein